MMIKLLKDLMRDKDGKYSIRKILIVLLAAATIISWIAQQFFDIQIPEYMFKELVSLLKHIISAPE